MVNPLSGHTATSLADGQSLTSASITNLYEAVHGNGIIRIDDGAYDDANRQAIGSGTAGLVTASSGGAVTVHGGYAVLGGVMYSFAGGPGATTNYTVGNVTWHLGSLPSVPGTTSDVIVTIYVCANNTPGVVNVQHHFGTAVVPATGTPLAASTVLSAPEPTNNQEAIILATLKYTMTGGAANVTASLNTPTVSDKRCFIRPSPIYLTPLNQDDAGDFAEGDAIDHANQGVLDTMGKFTGTEQGAFAASPFGAIWQSHSPDGHARLYYSARNSQGGTPARNTWRLAPNEVKVISTASNQTFTFDGPNIWIITTSGNITLNPAPGPFPTGYTIEVYHAAGSHNLNFDATALNTNVTINLYGKFVYTGSAWAKLDLHTVS
jgi:hypothetical protein